MAVPSDPPAVTPAGFQTWAQDVADTAQDHDTRIGTLETAPSGTTDPLDFGFPWTYEPHDTQTTTSGSSNNRANYMRSKGGGTITKIGLLVGTSSGNIDVGVYASTTMAPSTRKGSSGSTPCPASGWAEVALGSSVDVVVGDWLALSIDNVTATFRAPQSSSATNFDIWRGFVAFQNSGFPLPATATPTAGSARAFNLRGVA